MTQSEQTQGGQVPPGHGIRLNLGGARMFTLQLGVLMGSGVPIIRSLEAMAVADHAGLSPCADYLARKLASGWTLSTSMATLPDAFDRTTVSLVKVGERTGSLVATLEEATRRNERLLESSQKLKQAMAYPIVVLVVATAMLAFLCCYMLPRFLPIFESFSVELPWPTRVVMALTSARGLLLTLLLLLAMAAGVLLRSDHPRARRARAWLIFDLPLVGSYNRTTACADLCSDLALMLRSGVSLTDALGLVASQVRDPRLGQAMRATRTAVLQGDDFLEALERQGELPSMLVGTLAAGGESGRLAPLLSNLSRILVEVSDHQRERLTLLLEPLMIGFMGLVVGFILLACFLPLYRLIAVKL